MSVSDNISRTYKSDLVKNLSVDSVSNPNYLCQQKFSQCGHLADPNEKQKCEVFWSGVCQPTSSTTHNNMPTQNPNMPTLKS